jgi:hypothetical protein
MFPGGRIEHQMIEDALALAREQLAVRNVPLDVLAVASPSAKCVPGDTQQSPPEASVAATAVAHVKNPGECRGTIMQMGNMPRVLPDKKITMYGVRCMGDDGVETTIWGVNLRTKLKDAGASVGDRVEIVKKGSKVMEEGKAPMTVFEVRKL